MSERNRKRIRQKNTPQKQESKTNEKNTEPIDDDEEKNPQKSQKKQVPKNKNIETLKNEEENENDEMDQIKKVENDENNKTNGKNTKKKNDQKNGKNMKKNDDDDDDEDDDEDDLFTDLKKEDFEENNFNNEENDDEMLNEKEVVKLPFEKENEDEQLFSSLDIHENTMKSIQEMGFTKMTNIQAAAIPDALKGRDISGSAHTGSGKTLAFIIPAVELLVKAKFKPRNGTGVIILSPTRELSIQSYQVSRELLKYHEQKTVSLIMGGNDRDTEEEKLLKGSNIVIGTPGRILDHLKNTKGFLTKNLKMLIFDEADRLLDSGFEEEIIQILSFLPKKRQTLLFSATQSENVEHLAKLSLRKGLKEIHIDKQKQLATVEGLEQGYIVCDSDARFLLLFTFLKRNLKKKIIVFFSSCDSVKFHTDLLNYVDISVLSLHGKQKQKKRSKTFFEFKNTDKGILLSTDVAARGLDIPGVDWIVQFDPPDEPTDYIHRVGRTARGIDGKGKALLFLLPSELKFLQFLKQSKVKLEEYEFPKNKIANVQSQLEKLVSNNYYLNKAAQEAYRGYLLSYASHHLKEVYNVHDLDLQKIAKSLGLQVPPKISINISMTNKSTRAIPRHTKKRTRKSFNDDKTTKKRRMNEKRQFVV